MNARFEQDFAEQFGEAHPMQEVAKPVSAAELKTAHDIERGHQDRINGLPQKEGESEAYNEVYNAKESGLWAQ